MPEMTYVMPLVSLIVGVLGGAFGAYISMRVGLAVLESRMMRAERDIDTMSNEVRTDLQNLNDRLADLSREFGERIGEIIGKASGDRDSRNMNRDTARDVARDAARDASRDRRHYKDKNGE